MTEFERGVQNGLILGLTLKGLPIYVTVGDDIVLSYRAADVINLFGHTGWLNDAAGYNYPGAVRPAQSDMLSFDREFLSDNAEVVIQ